MEKQALRPHFDWLDMGKGLGMILVVAGHSLSPYRSVYYLFHVVYFMMLSGFLYHSDTPFGKYLWKKITTLYIPFVGWNFIIMLIRDVYAFVISDYPLSVFLKSRASHYYLTLLTFYKDGSYLGAIWFLGALFLISVVYKLVDMIVPKFRFRQLVILIIFGIPAVVGMFYPLPYLQTRTLICALFFAIGQVLRLHWNYLKRFAKLSFGILLLTMTCILSNFTTAALGTNNYERPGLFLISAFIGSFSMICFVVSLDNNRFALFVPLKKLLTFLGKHSKEILIWHFIIFRLVVIARLIHDGQPLSVAFPQEKVYHAGEGWWVIYTIVGLFVSIAWASFLRIGPWGWLLRKLHLIDK